MDFWTVIIVSVLGGPETILCLYFLLTSHSWIPWRDPIGQASDTLTSHLFPPCSDYKLQRRQDEDVRSLSQDCFCGGPLPLHGRVQPAAGGVWHPYQEPRPGCDPPGTYLQIPVDMCCGVFHGILPDSLWCLSGWETGEFSGLHQLYCVTMVRLREQNNSVWLCVSDCNQTVVF